MNDKPLHVFTNDEDYVIATDVDDARDVYEEHAGPDLDNMVWEQRDDAKPFTLHDDDAITKTCGEWAAEKGRGYFANANY